MKLVLAAIDSKFIHSNLALRYLKKIAEPFPCEVQLMEATVNDELDHVLADLIFRQPHLLVFSCYIWNIAYIRHLIASVKLLLPKTIILCGGPEVAYDAEPFLNSVPCDAVLAGEGEAVFPPVLDQLCRAFQNGTLSPETLYGMLRKIPGLYLRRPGEGVVHTGAAPLADMSSLPFPYDPEDFERLKNRIVYYEGQRGCPYGCTYCLSSIDRTLRHKPVGMVKTELLRFMEAKVPLVKFVDRTFNVQEDWAFAVVSFILEQTRERAYATAFHFEVGAAALSDRLIELFRSAPKGLFQIEAGIQSTDPKVLGFIERVDDPQKISRTLERILQGKAVHVHTDLIAGLPGDTLETFRKSFNDCMRMRPQMLQVGFLKVLKGTPLDQQKERFGIIHRSWPPYEVLKTGQMSYDELLQIKQIESITEKYYNSGKFPASIKYLLSIYEEPWELFIKIKNILSDYEKHNNIIKTESYYSALNDLRLQLRPEDTEIMGELLRFDYILSNRRGPIPDELISQEYNSLRGRLISSEGMGAELKGSVAGFKIEVLRYLHDDIIIHGDTLIFYTLALPELIAVKQVKDSRYARA